MSGTDLPDGVGVARLDREPDGRFLRLRDDLGVTSFGINKLVLGPGQRNRIHRHTVQEEVYLVLAGELSLALEGVEHRFAVGELVRVGPGVRRQLINRGPGMLELLALGSQSDRTHAPRDAEAFSSWDDSEPGTPQTVPLPADLEPGELRS